MTAPALPRITAQDAEAEPSNVRTFPTPAASFPKQSYSIGVMSPAGYPITVTYNNMTLDRLEEALAVVAEYRASKKEAS